LSRNHVSIDSNDGALSRRAPRPDRYAL
jgi:hypothetical protein